MRLMGEKTKYGIGENADNLHSNNLLGYTYRDHRRR